jgi:transcriptional regulator with XRE-family HTH domain
MTEPAKLEPTAPSTGQDRHGGADDVIADVGSRVRKMRTAQGLTLKGLAERIGISVSMLSMLERGVSSASVGTLVSVASALGAHMSDLFNSDSGRKAPPVTRKAEQPTFDSGQGASRRLAHQDTATGVEFVVNEYTAGGTSGDAPTHHPGREFGVVVVGRLTVEVDGETYDLAVGDAIAYSSARPHRISNRSRGRTVAVWVNITS